ncbi:MAG TPA: hypothetical protein VHZ97_21680 [Pseudonocardiaceae bacterium]|jgi:hypothetical protein|nr:hypothetical protein [Pseudonocardiaceae bacterium]
MNDRDDVRDLLGAALQGEPPSAVDPARLMRMGKRRLRLQRAGAALGVMVVAGGIALGAGLIHQAGKGPGPGQISTAGTPQTSGPPLTLSPAQSPPTSPGPFSAPDTAPTLPEGQNTLVAQNQALSAAFPLPKGMVAANGKFALTATRPASGGYSGAQLNTRLTDHLGSGRFSLNVVVTGGGFSAMNCDGSKMNCSIQVLDGITVEVESDHPTATTTRILTVAASPAGNLLVEGEVDNIAATGKSATRSTPPVAAGQLAQITAAVATR